MREMMGLVVTDHFKKMVDSVFTESLALIEQSALAFEQNNPSFEQTDPPVEQATKSFEQSTETFEQSTGRLVKFDLENSIEDQITLEKVQIDDNKLDQVNPVSVDQFQLNLINGNSNQVNPVSVPIVQVDLPDEDSLNSGNPNERNSDKKGSEEENISEKENVIQEKEVKKKEENVANVDDKNESNYENLITQNGSLGKPSSTSRKTSKQFKENGTFQNGKKCQRIEDETNKHDSTNFGNGNGNGKVKSAPIFRKYVSPVAKARAKFLAAEPNSSKIMKLF